MDDEIPVKKAHLEYLLSGSPILTNEGYLFRYDDEPRETFYIEKEFVPDLLDPEGIYLNCDNEYTLHLMCTDLDETQVVNDDINKKATEESQVLGQKAEWDDNNTKLLLRTYHEMKQENKYKTKKKLFCAITEVQKKYGYDVTPLQVENRFKTLERGYKKVLENDNKTGRGRKTCAYQKELDEIFTKEANVFPEALASVSSCLTQNDLLERAGLTPSITTAADDEIAGSSKSDSGSSTPSSRSARSSTPTTSSKKKSITSKPTQVLNDILQVFKTSEEAATARHVEKMTAMKEKNALLKAKNELLQRLVDNK